MERLITWFIDNPVAANLLMFILIMTGIMGLQGVHKEEFPDVEVQIITITVPYLGAAPAEVESGVCTRIEEAVEGIEGIDKINTTAAEGMCVVSIELAIATEIGKALDDVKAQVNAITTLPANTERPIVSQMTLRTMVNQILVSGATDEHTLKDLTEQVREELLELPQISHVEMMYVREDEISVEISERTLRQYGLSLRAVADAIRDSSIDVPGGSLKTAGGEILLRATGQRYQAEQFANIPVISRADGTIVTLADIATISEGFENKDMGASLNGDPAMMLQVSRYGEEDTLDVANAVIAYVEAKQATLPPGLRVTIWRNEADDLLHRLQALLNNAFGGLLLVILLLTLFLKTRLALWVSAGIPVSILGALALFPAFDLSISTVSLVGFLLSLGILVDDAIVIGERVYAYELIEPDGRLAAIKGTTEVAVPVFFGVLTTIAAFIPVVSVESDLGKMLSAIGVTVMLCLVFSLVESQLILPSHLAHRRKARGQSALGARWEQFQEKISAVLENFAQTTYRNLVSAAVRARYVTVACGAGAMIVVLAMIISERVIFQFFPAVTADDLYARVELPEGTPLAVTLEATARLEAAADRLTADLDAMTTDGLPAARARFTSIGQAISRSGMSLSAASNGAHIAEVSLALRPVTERGGLTPLEAINRWRDYTGTIPDVVELSFSAAALSMGADINIELRGKDDHMLGNAATEIGDLLASFDGVLDISDSYRSGKQELTLAINDNGRSLGLTQADLGRQVRQAFYGAEAQRVQRGRDDVRVMVRYPESERDALSHFENMRVRLADGSRVPVLSVADVVLGRGYSAIRRVDGSRVVNITASTDRTKISPEALYSSIADKQIPEILSRHPGVGFHLAGEAEERAEALGGLIRMSVVALLVIYALLAIPLKSYLQPLVVMSSIPFGLLGAILGHFIMREDLVFFSILGIVALSGVVVNASLVLVDYVNRQRRNTAIAAEDAVIAAGVTRFRPIVLTSLTTFIGLVPLMINRDFDTILFVPLAISLGFGVVFATTVTLLLIPALYMVLEDFQRWIRGGDYKIQGEQSLSSSP